MTVRGVWVFREGGRQMLELMGGGGTVVSWVMGRGGGGGGGGGQLGGRVMRGGCGLVCQVTC